MKNLESKIKEIQEVVESLYFISDREAELERRGFCVEELPMGFGGVLQVKAMKSGETRIQIGYGHGKHNYAKAVVI